MTTMNSKTQKTIDIKKILKEQREEYQRLIGNIFKDMTLQIKLISVASLGIQKQMELILLENRVAKLERLIAQK